MTDSTLRRILMTLDTAAFRQVTGAVDATDDQVLEAMHIARSESLHVPRVKRMDSKRWLYRRRH